MQKNFVEELRWRGMLHDIMPETEDHLNQNITSGYIGFDPTADSLHIGSLVQIMILIHFQRAGHRPIALVGGATGMIGDPSGKSDERNLLDAEALKKNEDGIRNQLQKFLDFHADKPSAAQLVNNYDWMKDYSLIDFSRDIGKHLTVNYMMAKDSVKKRLGSDSKVGMSFTEFTYQLLQGYDFLHLYQNMDCKLQMGGSDQWGNITTGTELIRRKLSGKAYAITCPLITKADGTKFGKTEGGNVWLDKTRTSPYKFYQYWLNASDEDAENFIKIFTLLDKATIEDLIKQHHENPHMRLLQKTIAEEVTRMVHSEEDLSKAIQASQILFGRSTAEDLKNLDRQTFLEVFEGVPQSEISHSDLNNGIDMIALLASQTSFLKSNGEARRALSENSISINKTKVNESYTIGSVDLIDDQYILLQRGKKNYFIVKVVR
ncbi:tyrosine--tRNA ligase [Flavobacteriaceae bacterium]|nr:tyrosine--tRNA ligase [Flavobacteriaceae bacterium]MBL6693046.1 tyrosine--tRNA ligase [Flavobacteriaceae bacterium]MDA8758296.1 tyrosine--tRNA ligase [Flavobacteriaceae bacterium]MDA8762912.1 tyrosine--tRNA ligase [Flavobacteriaceae bacterium]